MAYQDALAALADPTRRTLVERLRQGPRTVTDLAHGLPVSRPAVSQHLAVLKAAGLVSERRAGTRRFYRLAPEGVLPLRRWLEEMWGTALDSYAAAVAAEPEDHER